MQHTAIYIEAGEVRIEQFDPADRNSKFTRLEWRLEPGVVGILAGDLVGHPFWVPDWFTPEAGCTFHLPTHPGWWNNGAHIDIWVRPGHPENLAVLNGRDFCKVSGLTPGGWRPGRHRGSNPTTIECDNGERTYS
jgi:hypothetical protein